MSMSLKQEIETWVSALAQYDNNEFEAAMKTFDAIADTSKILFNIGVIHATIGEHNKAVECYQRAVKLDMYLAVAYFQQGVSNFQVGDFEEALANFNDTLLYLRGNTYIDYDQLGLKFKLHSAEVLFNRGLCYIYLSQLDLGMSDLMYAAQEKAVPDHDVIDEAIKDNGDGYNVFSIPVGVIYRPNSAKVKNLKTKDYLGKARLIASAEQGNAGSGGGPENKRVMVPVVQDDRSPDSISYAATNLVRSDLASRSRQQSEPPINRNMFPPTPPPEEQPRPSLALSRGKSNTSLLTTRSNSIRDGANQFNSSSTRLAQQQPPVVEEEESRYRGGVPPPLEIGSPHPPTLSSPESNGRHEKPRLGNLRTASEPRGPMAQRSTNRTNRTRHGHERIVSQENFYQHSTPSRGRLFGEQIPSPGGNEADIDEAPEELHELYGNTASSNPFTSPRREASRPRNRSQSRRRQQRMSGGAYPSETETTAPSAHTHSAHSSLDFEIVNSPVSGNGGGVPSANTSISSRHTNTERQRRPPLPTSHSFSSTHSHATTISFAPSHGHSYSFSSSHLPREEQRTIRVKMHAGDETRYLMISSGINYEEFVDKVKEKLGVKAGVKIKVKDEEDYVTLGDRDDWEMALGTAKGEAKGKGEEMGRLEVWVHETA